ncbi:MAG: solute carrier family 23 protein [Kiritimatiellae bacterium]|nr:solute carrier family 23 protein [Kiritimatiellia bacterium]
MKYEYRYNEVPPFRHIMALSMQHVLLMFTSLALPVILGAQINASIELTGALLAFSMISAGIGSIVQSLRLPLIGSGYLCPNVCGPSYFSLQVSAAWAGGIPLMRGMTMIAGLVEMTMAPVVQKLKGLFPNYVVGMVVALVGVSVITPTVTSLFGLSYRGDAIASGDILIGAFALTVMVLCNVWGKGIVKMYCLLIGMAAGWIAGLIALPAARDALVLVTDQPWMALPRMPWKFFEIRTSFGLFIPFVVIGISGSLKSFGNLLAIQRLSQPDLQKPDFKPIRNGLMADGFSTVLAGALGGLAVDTSSSNVGLAGSTKVLSRCLSTAAGILFILFALSPKLTTVFSLIPKPVLGASMTFAACFMIVTGLQQMFAEPWDTRKTFVIGIALFLGLSTAFLPYLYARAPHTIQSFFTDPLPTSTLLAVILNQVINLDLTWAAWRKRSFGK